MESNSILIKGLVVGAIILVMLIPIHLVKSLIEERESTKDSVDMEISSKWGGEQHLIGPILVLPYTETQTITSNNKVEAATVNRYAYFLPENINVVGDISTEERSRTLYQSLVYQSNMNVSGSFDFPDCDKLHIKL